MAGGGAVSLQIGPPDAPLRIGLISLPLRSPATLADFSPLLNADGQSRTDNQRDVRMITAGHEFYHLIDFAARNAYHYSANRDAQMPQMDQKDEVYADRGLIGDIPALVRAGIVSDARIALDLIAARQLETMQRFALSRVQSGPGQGAVIVLDEHAVGYSLTSRDSLEAQQQRVIQAGTEIRAVFRNAIDRAFEEAADGKAPPHVQDAYAASQESYERMARYYPAPSTMSPEEVRTREQNLRLQAFTETMMESPQFMRTIAAQMQAMPSLSPASVGMAGDFISAYERLIKPTTPPPAPAPEIKSSPLQAPKLSTQTP